MKAWTLLVAGRVAEYSRVHRPPAATDRLPSVLQADRRRQAKGADHAVAEDERAKLI